MIKLKYIVGIDPGVNNGFANWCKTTKELIDLKTLSFWKLIIELDKLRKLKEEAGLDLLIIIEDPNKNRPVFDKGVQSQKAINKIAQNVGENKRIAKLLIEYCEEHGISYSAITPRTAKWDKNTFFKITNCKFECSQHARDAAKLCYGY